MNKIISLEQAQHYLTQLDLNYIIKTMCSESYPLPRWTLADATHCAQLYRNFLFLQKKYFSENLIPTREIDEFWHNHILFTKNYWQDCANIFGHYLHHEPAREGEAEKIVAGYQRTQALYFAEFQQNLTCAS